MAKSAPGRFTRQLPATSVAPETGGGVNAIATSDSVALPVLTAASAYSIRLPTAPSTSAANGSSACAVLRTVACTCRPAGPPGSSDPPSATTAMTTMTATAASAASTRARPSCPPNVCGRFMGLA